jgi:transposase
VAGAGLGRRRVQRDRRYVAQRLVADGEIVLDVPAKLSARARVLSTGHGRKTDATDTHSIAGARTRTANRLHRLLLELIPAGAPRFLSAMQAKALLATVRPRDVAGRTGRHLAAELLPEIVVLDRKLKDSGTSAPSALQAAEPAGVEDQRCPLEVGVAVVHPQPAG